jgi:hypothetical protein
MRDWFGTGWDGMEWDGMDGMYKTKGKQKTCKLHSDDGRCFG